jgi:hypothetical protein
MNLWGIVFSFLTVAVFVFVIFHVGIVRKYVVGS